MKVMDALQERSRMIKANLEHPEVGYKHLTNLAREHFPGMPESSKRINTVQQLRMVGGLIVNAPLYLLDGSICPLVSQGADTLPIDARLTEDSFKTHWGLMFLEEHPKISEMPAGTTEVDGGGLNKETVEVRLHVIGWTKYLEQDYDKTKDQTPYPMLRVYGWFKFVMGNKTMHYPVPLVEYRYRYGMEWEGEESFQHPGPKEDLVAGYNAKTMSWLFAATLFMKQKILSVHESRAPREYRRKVEHGKASPPPSDIGVVLLRERAHAKTDGEGDPVEWSCRWLVTGHWRQQWYAKEQIHIPIWILPYVKGPEDKPLKPESERIFHVKR
jgi:hypothetical protein